MTEFVSGLVCGFIILALVLIYFDKSASDMDLHLKIGNILCEDHKGLRSFDFNTYTCVGNVVIAPPEHASKVLLQRLEQKLDK